MSWLGLIVFAIACLGSLLSWQQLRQQQEAREASERQHIETTARRINESVAQQLDTMLRSIDVITRHLASVYVHDRRNFDMAVRDVMSAFPKEMLQYVTVFGADGRLVYRSGNGAEGGYFGDRGYFVAARDDPHGQLHISEPILGPAAGTPLVQLTRAIRDGDRFVGVIGIPLRPDYLSRTLYELHRTPNDMIAVVRNDGSFVSRSRKLEEALSRKVPADRPYLLAQPGEQGSFRSVSTVDRVPLLFAWSRLANWPVSTAVGLNEADLLQPLLDDHISARRHTRYILSVVLIAAALIALLLHRIERRNRALADSEYRFRHFFEANKSVMLLIRPEDGQIVAANAAAGEFYGYAPAELPGMSIAAINALPPDAVAAEMRHAVLEERNYFRFQHRLASGEIREVEVYSTPVRMGSEHLLFSIVHDVSERERLAQALASEFDKNQALLRNASDGICIVNTDGRIEEVSDSFCALLGYSREAMIGMHVSQWDVKMSPDTIDDAIAEIVARGTRMEFETIHRSREGMDIPVEVSAIAFLYQGRPLIFTATRNIALRQQQEQALRDERRRLNDILQGTHAGTWEWNVQTGQTVFNERWADIIGYTLAELGPPSIDTWLRLVHIDDLPESNALLARHFAGELPYYECEVRMKHKDGHWVWIIDRGKVSTWTDDGKPLLMSGTHQDVSERKAAELRLRDALQKNATLLRNSSDGIHILDSSGRLVEASDTFLQMLGYTRDEILGKTPDFWDAEMLSGDIADAVRQNIQQPQRLQFETRHRHKNGRIFAVEISTVPIQIGDERLLFNSSRNIEERKALDAELEAYRHGLEQIVEQRTADLAVAKEAAEAASRAKSAFLSMASHELRTPMNGVMGMLALLKNRARDPALLDYLNKADRASRQLLAIINDVLDISRIESNRLSLAAVPFTLPEVRHHVLDALEDIARDKGLALLFLPDDTLETQTFIGDPTRLAQVLINLVGNAIKFTSEGHVTVSTQRVPASREDSVRLHFDVQDTGIGIRAEDLARIFEPFEQADKSSSRKYGGTGLGLALCEKLTRAMGGRIGVDSELGIGSRFWFEIEVAPSPDSLPAPVDPGVLAEHIVARHRGARVLLVEDEPLNQLIAREMLEAVGLTVFTAEDGLEAVECARRQPYDLILMDMNMPRLNGIDATREIRRLPACASIPIIAMTANAFTEDRNACLAAGMNGHIGKPVIPETLHATLLHWLDWKQAQG